MQQDINEAHQLFKNFVADHRPSLNIEQVATGESWFATQAKDFDLVDALNTSDDYLLQHHETAQLINLRFHEPKKLYQKLPNAAQAVFEKVFYALWKQQ